MKPERPDKGEGDEHSNGVTNKSGSPPVFNRSSSLARLLPKKLMFLVKKEKKKEETNKQIKKQTKKR